jgi:hypothetical protein
LPPRYWAWRYWSRAASTHVVGPDAVWKWSLPDRATVTVWAAAVPVRSTANGNPTPGAAGTVTVKLAAVALATTRSWALTV